VIGGAGSLLQPALAPRGKFGIRRGQVLHRQFFGQQLPLEPLGHPRVDSRQDSWHFIGAPAP
jgi:hypothetical protein